MVVVLHTRTVRYRKYAVLGTQPRCCNKVVTMFRLANKEGEADDQIALLLLGLDL
jgi:hypothetical protein